MARRTCKAAIGLHALGADARLAVTLYAVAAGIALGYEVVWTQVIVQFLSTRAVAFAAVLATYLLGLVVGSWVFARFADRVVARWSVFGGLIAAAGIAAMASFALLGPWLPEAQNAIGTAVGGLTGSRMLQMLARFAFAVRSSAVAASTRLSMSSRAFLSSSRMSL